MSQDYSTLFCKYWVIIHPLEAFSKLLWLGSGPESNYDGRNCRHPEASLNIYIAAKLVLCLGCRLQLRLKASHPRSHFYMLHKVCDYILWLNILRLILTNTNLICELQCKISIWMQHLYGHIRETCHIRWAPGQKHVNAWTPEEQSISGQWMGAWA